MRKRLRVLAIEDDPALGTLYESVLSDEGHEVRVAHDAREGLRLMRDPPDVVLLDLMLPGIDGYEVLRRMRRQPQTKDTPVIVVSATVPPDRHRIPGANAVIHKPFALDGLLRSIEGLAHRHAA
jgi:DNA-binding response OmpR family regulator